MSLLNLSSNAAARSLQVFGLYLCVAGTALLLAPTLLLAPLGLAVPQDVWIRLVGILALALGVSDVLAGRSIVAPLIRWSVWRRLAAGGAISALVVLGLAPTAMLLFAAADIAAALWTAMAVRRFPPASLYYA